MTPEQADEARQAIERLARVLAARRAATPPKDV